MTVPETLDYKMRVFRESGHVVYSKRELFIETNWVAVFLGQDVMPGTTDLRVNCTSRDRIAAHLLQLLPLLFRCKAVAQGSH